MNIDYAAVLAYAMGLILLYIMGRLFIIPLKIVLKLVYNGLIGGIVLLMLNYLGKFIGLHIAINPVTSLVVGFLGVPGVILLIILKYIL